MVQRVVQRELWIDGDAPRLATPPPNFRDGRIQALWGDGEARLEAMGVRAAEVVQIAVLRLDELHFEGRVRVAGAPGVDDEVDVGPLLVHVTQACLHVVVPATLGRQVLAHERLEVPFLPLDGPCFAEPAGRRGAPPLTAAKSIPVAIWRLADLASHADADLDAVLVEVVDPLADDRVEVGCDGLRRRPHVGIGVEYFETVAHGVPPNVASSRPETNVADAVRYMVREVHPSRQGATMRLTP